MILVMLLLVLTIVQGTGGDLYVILLFEGRGRFVLLKSFEQKDDTKIAASAGGYIRIARQWRFLVFIRELSWLFGHCVIVVEGYLRYSEHVAVRRRAKHGIWSG